MRNQLIVLLITALGALPVMTGCRKSAVLQIGPGGTPESPSSPAAPSPIPDEPDTTPPAIGAFTLSAPADSLTASITSLSGTDNIAVTGYLVTETASSPSASTPGWSASPPTSFLFATFGTKTLYAWAKDAAGNVSPGESAQLTLTQTASWAGAENVLVLFNESWPDGDGNGVSDSQDVAEYYAAKRGIPAENMLGVECTTNYTMSYADFHAKILSPLVAHLEQVVGGEVLSNRIFYIVPVYGVPVQVNTQFVTSEHPFWPSGSYAHNVRSLDQWLMNPFRHHENGVSPGGKPYHDDKTTLLGDSSSEIYNNYYASIPTSTQPTLAQLLPRTFFKKRASTGINFLVTRLDGASTLIAKSLVDKALYAETYLMRQDDPLHPFRPVALVDSDKGRSHGHESHAATLVQLLQGLISSVFSPANSAMELYLGSPFDLISDWIGPGNGPEVGEAGHIPEVGGTIASVNAGTSTITMGASDRVDFFVIGKPITSSAGGEATITGVNVGTKSLTLSNVDNFNATNTVSQKYAGTLPIALHWIYTFYSYGAYRDVYQFRVGALGRHMDSGSCANIRSSAGTWCAKSLIRNITAVSGAVSEPASSGEAYMDYVMAALTLGANAADSFYNGLVYGNRWMALVISDPLYAPFRNWASHIADSTSPAFGEIKSVAGGLNQRKISVTLGGATPGELLDVAQYKIEYGLTESYGQAIAYDDFSGTVDGTWDNNRRYFFARQFDWTLSGLTPATTYHYRVIARDPYGNETVSPDYTFTMP